MIRARSGGTLGGCPRSVQANETDFASDSAVHVTRKGCGIGYALAASSCEGVGSVDACTVAALDAITAFAVPNPDCSSQSESVFSGLVAQ